MTSGCSLCESPLGDEAACRAHSAGRCVVAALLADQVDPTLGREHLVEALRSRGFTGTLRVASWLVDRYRELPDAGPVELRPALTYTRHEVARILGVSLPRVDQLRRDGYLTAARRANGSRAFCRPDVHRVASLPRTGRGIEAAAQRAG